MRFAVILLLAGMSQHSRSSPSVCHWSDRCLRSPAQFLMILDSGHVKHAAKTSGNLHRIKLNRGFFSRWNQLEAVAFFADGSSSITKGYLK